MGTCEPKKRVDYWRGSTSCQLLSWRVGGEEGLHCDGSQKGHAVPHSQPGAAHTLLSISCTSYQVGHSLKVFPSAQYSFGEREEGYIS